MKKLLFLYNTHAGKGLLKSRLAAVQDALAAAGWDVTIHPTQGAGDATAVAAARAGEFDRIVCSGGDGTLHEVVAGLMGLENRPEVGYIPAGTTNDFAKNLSLPRGMEAMARVAAAGVPRPVDIGSFNDRYFIYVAAFGAFTDVAYSTPQPVKNIFGHLAYVLEGATRLGSIQAYPLTVEHDGGVEEGAPAADMAGSCFSPAASWQPPAEVRCLPCTASFAKSFRAAFRSTAPAAAFRLTGPDARLYSTNIRKKSAATGKPQESRKS